MWVSLIDHDQWSRADLGDDPLDSHQPDEVVCDIAGWREENGQLEVDTGRCNYLWLTQPSLAAIPAGAPLALEVRHFDLTSATPADAHFAVLLGDAVAWETTIQIPAPGNVRKVEWEAPRELPKGGRIGVHLHNHGQNTWGLVNVSVGMEP